MNQRGDFNEYDLLAKVRNSQHHAVVWVKIRCKDGRVVEAPLSAVETQPLHNVDSEIRWLIGEEK